MTSRQLITRLEQQLASMRAELASLETTGLSGDLKTVLLRDGIPATEYRLELERAEANMPQPTCRSQHAAANMPQPTCRSQHAAADISSWSKR